MFDSLYMYTDLEQESKSQILCVLKQDGKHVKISSSCPARQVQVQMHYLLSILCKEKNNKIESETK